MAGRFITFEGGEGAGKSTQARRLAAYLTDRGHNVTVTREPGGTPIAESIRDFILSGEAKALGAESEAVLFAAARADHVDKVIRPALARGGWVLCDRFIDSTRVYQGSGDGVDPALVRALERVAIGDTRPDLTVILDVPAETGMKRLAERSGSPDRFESDDLARHEVRRQAYLDIARREPERCVVVDAARSEEDVADSIRRIVDLRLLDRAA
jgi:dTMP kinase